MDANKITNLYKRTIEDSLSILKHAKLDERIFTPITQVIYYHDSVSVESNSLKLLELDDHILSQIRDGQNIQFKGGLNEKVILCTDEKTYEVKIAETSNSLLLVPGLKFGQVTSTSPLKSPNNRVPQSLLNLNSKDHYDNDLERTHEIRKLFSICHEYLECREIRPGYPKLRNLLSMTAYTGPENEHMIDKKLLFTFEQLLDTVQCGRLQFIEGLKVFHAFEVDGYIRILNFDYECRVIGLMVDMIDENSWQQNEIDRKTTIDSLNGIVPKQVVEGVFDMYTTASDITDKFQYKIEMVARIIAKNILQCSLKFHFDEFMDIWQLAMPECMKVKVCLLQGLAIIEKDLRNTYIRELIEEDLPTNLKDRLNILFKNKKQWTYDEIEPYLQNLTTPLLPVSGILAKHTRTFIDNDIRYFCSL